MRFLFTNCVVWMSEAGEWKGLSKGRSWADKENWQKLMWGPASYPEPVARRKSGSEIWGQTSQVRLAYVSERMVCLAKDDAPMVLLETDMEKQNRHRKFGLVMHRFRCHPWTGEQADGISLTTWIAWTELRVDSNTQIVVT